MKRFWCHKCGAVRRWGVHVGSCDRCEELTSATEELLQALKDAWEAEVAQVEPATGSLPRHWTFEHAGKLGTMVVEFDLGPLLDGLEASDLDTSGSLSIRTVPPVGLGVLRHVMGVLFSRDTCEHIFEPLLTDIEFEYRDAVDAGRLWKARGIRTRGILDFTHGILAYATLRAVETVGGVVRRGRTRSE